jgi:hypothetical protein
MTTTNLTSTIDRLGVLQAQIAQLEIEESYLKATMIENGPGKYQGDTYAITVTEPFVREAFDKVAKAAIDELVAKSFSTQWVTAHTVKTSVKPSVRVSVRKDVEVAA